MPRVHVSGFAVSHKHTKGHAHPYAYAHTCTHDTLVANEDTRVAIFAHAAFGLVACVLAAALLEIARDGPGDPDGPVDLGPVVLLAKQRGWARRRFT